MIFYVVKFLKAYNMLKDYVKKHSEDSEMQEILGVFGESFGYTASGKNRIVDD